ESSSSISEQVQPNMRMTFNSCTTDKNSEVPVHSVLFFFQAEDGIRDSSVTGVQTCALPISQVLPSCSGKTCGQGDGCGGVCYARSEERRVGKGGWLRGLRPLYMTSDVPFGKT